MRRLTSLVWKPGPFITRVVKAAIILFLALQQLTCHTLCTLLLGVCAVSEAKYGALNGALRQFFGCALFRQLRQIHEAARQLGMLALAGRRWAWQRQSLRAFVAFVAFAIQSLNAARLWHRPLACPAHLAQDFPRAVPTNGEIYLALPAFGALFPAALSALRSTKPFNFGRWGWCGFFLIHPIILISSVFGAVLAGAACCVLHVIKTVGSRFAVLLPSSLDGPSTPSSETQSLGCVQERRERRSQYLRERRECKKLRRLSKRLRQAWEEKERRSQLESKVNW